MEQWKKFQVQGTAEGLSVECYLRSILGLSKAQVRSLKFREQGILVNGERVRITQVLGTGDTLQLCMETEEQDSAHLISGENMPKILYEDDDLTAVFKPAMIPVHPAHGHYADSLANQLMNYCRSKGEIWTIRCIGRLDLETSGIVLFAKNKITAAKLSKAREEGSLQKEYTALCRAGKDAPFLEKQGVICQPIGPVENSLMKMEVSDGELAKHAVTRYQVLSEADGVAYVSLALETGRTHQIRVHMAWLGHPLLGDRIYGTRDSRINRAALHAGTLIFKHPFTGETIRIEAEEPEDIKRIRMELANG